jgi:predicted GNAT superfamily acetyltransferase
MGTVSGMLRSMDDEALTVRLRPVEDSDVAAVTALNEAHVPHVGPADEARIAYLRGLSHRFDVIEVGGRVGGLVVTFTPGSSYDSANYRWFSERLGTEFYYLDRVVVDAEFRRRGVAGRVYDELEAVAAGYGQMALEVNLVPRNEGSLLFHAQRGYVEIGQLGDAEHLVSMMTKRLP